MRFRCAPTALAAALVLLTGCTTGPAPTAPRFTIQPITPGPVSSLPMEALRTEIIALAGRDLRSIGEGSDGLVVTVAAGAESVAREIYARYGGSVSVGLGRFPYPPPGAAERSCMLRPSITEAPPGLVATIEMIGRTVARGENFDAMVRIASRRSVPFDLETSSNFEIYLFRPNDPFPIGAPDGGRVGTGWGVTLPPGGSEQLEAFGGTSSCDIAVGYVVPTGIYQARALVDYIDTTDLNRPLSHYWSEPLMIEVVDESIQSP